MKGSKIGALLAGTGKIGLDSSVLMYQFDDHPVHARVTSRIFNRVAAGLPAVLSTVALLELLVRPYRSGPKAAAEADAVLKDLPNFTFLPATAEIAAEAARLRAKYGLEIPDALHLATSIVSEADLFITNDAGFRSAAHREDIRIVFLDDCRE